MSIHAIAVTNFDSGPALPFGCSERTTHGWYVTKLVPA